MRCAWKELLGILPRWIAGEADSQGQQLLQEIRLRVGKPPEFVGRDGIREAERECTKEDLLLCVNGASRYSPWASRTIAQGYVTAPGGHRVGICGEAVVKDGCAAGIREPESLCIRVARDISGIAGKAKELPGSILLLGPPGSGKTTLLRDLAREISRKETVAVVDERGELFPERGGFDRGKRLDVLRGCPKEAGVDMVLRTMGPDVIAVDEITAEGDCRALLRAGWCGVRLIATAHASSLGDLRRRSVYRTLWEGKLFDHILILSRDKSWHLERMDR